MIRGKPGLTAILAAAGLFQIADWLRGGLLRVRQARAGAPRLPAGAGEVRIETESVPWVLTADLQPEPGTVVWLLVTGPRELAAAAISGDGAPLRFALDPGPAGTYRFWVIPSRKRMESSRSLVRKAPKALAAGVFVVH